MTKGALGRLGKLKCMLIKWRARHHGHRLVHHDLGGDEEQEVEEHKKDAMAHGDPTEDTDQTVPEGMHPVYVGKSRRRYLIGSHLAGHPAFRVLVQRSGSVEKDEVHSGGGGSTVLAGCEVVLFEHLLWMLENADSRPEAIDELVDFYSC